MKLIAIIFLFALCFTTTFAQHKEQLFFKEFPAEKFNHLMVSTGYGRVFLTSSVDQLGAQVMFLFSEEDAPKAVGIMDKISITHVTRNDSLFITTNFNEKLLKEDSDLMDLANDVVIEYRVKIPPHITPHVHQHHGQVFTGSIQNHIHVDLVDAALYAKMSQKITAKGDQFLIDASGVKTLEVGGEHGYLVLSNVGTGIFDLKRSSLESIGFETVEAQLSNCSFSSGTTQRANVKAVRSSVEFTDIREIASFHLTDVLFVLQKIPYRMTLSSLRGSNDLSLMAGRSVQVQHQMESSNTSINLRGGSVRATFVAKKTQLSFPDESWVKKKEAEYTQDSDHGLQLSAELKKGTMSIKK